jgi:hypothetical protein
MVTLSAEGGVSLLYPSKHLTGVQRKMKDSNLRRGFSPRRFSKPLLSATQPIFRVGRRWNRTTIAKGRNRTVSNTVVLTIQGALPSGNNWTRTSGLSIISRMLYQLSYVSKEGTIGLEPITPRSSGVCSTIGAMFPKSERQDLNLRLERSKHPALPN